MPDSPRFLGFDVGATKTSWGVFNEEGKILKTDRFPTPKEKEKFLAALKETIEANLPISAVGIGIAGTLSADHEDILICTNLPDLSHLQLADYIKGLGVPSVAIDNDARCALIGEVWQGAASDQSSAVMITLGTGVGGAVMQKGIVLPHPEDVSQELGRLVVDPSDVFPSPAGAGSVEAFIGGRSIEARFDVNLHEMAEKVRKKDEEAKEFWQKVSYFFIQCVRAIHMVYSCKLLIVGGIGSKDLPYYLQDSPPCPVVPAKLGAEAGLYGAGRIAIDKFEERQEEHEKNSGEWE